MAVKKQWELYANSEVSTPADFALSSGTPTEQYVKDLLGTGNTLLKSTITSSVPATALKATSDDYVYELNPGSADPWNNKLDTASTADTWTAQAYSEGAFVVYQGKAYMANATTTSSDVPGVSSLWTVAKLPYLFSSANTSLMQTTGGTHGTSTTTIPANGVIEITQASGTVNVTFADPVGNALRYCELIIRGVTADAGVTINLPENADALYGEGCATKAGINHFIFAEYDRTTEDGETTSHWLVNRITRTSTIS